MIYNYRWQAPWEFFHLCLTDECIRCKSECDNANIQPSHREHISSSFIQYLQEPRGNLRTPNTPGYPRVPWVTAEYSGVCLKSLGDPEVHHMQSMTSDSEVPRGNFPKPTRVPQGELTHSVVLLTSSGQHNMSSFTLFLVTDRHHSKERSQMNGSDCTASCSLLFLKKA